MALMIYFEFCFELNHPFLRLNSRRQRKKRGAELIEEMETIDCHIGIGMFTECDLFGNNLINSGSIRCLA